MRIFDYDFERKCFIDKETGEQINFEEFVEDLKKKIKESIREVERK